MSTKIKQQSSTIKATRVTLKLSPFFHIEKQSKAQGIEIQKTVITMHTAMVNQRLIQLLTHEFEILKALDLKESSAQKNKMNTVESTVAFPFYAKALRLEGATLYLEYINGINLKALIKQSTYAIPHRESLTLSLINTIKRLHQHQCLHLDLSPSNIMIDEMGCLKLIDFASALDFSKQNQATMLAPMKLYYSHPRLWDICFTAFDEPISLPMLSLSMGMKYDLLALVFILYELWSGRRFFQFSTQAIYDAKAKPETWESFKNTACALLEPKRFESICLQNMTQASYQRWISILDQYFYQAQGQGFKEWLEFFEPASNLIQ